MTKIKVNNNITRPTNLKKKIEEQSRKYYFFNYLRIKWI